jgi:hypothetical protein
VLDNIPSNRAFIVVTEEAAAFQVGQKSSYGFDNAKSGFRYLAKPVPYPAYYFDYREGRSAGRSPEDKLVKNRSLPKTIWCIDRFVIYIPNPQIVWPPSLHRQFRTYICFFFGNGQAAVFLILCVHQGQLCQTHGLSLLSLPIALNLTSLGSAACFRSIPLVQGIELGYLSFDFGPKAIRSLGGTWIIEPFFKAGVSEYPLLDCGEALLQVQIGKPNFYRWKAVVFQLRLFLDVDGVRKPHLDK